MPHHDQLALLDPPANRRAGAPLPVLEERASRGASFHEVPVKAILNSPATTGMGFWSLNPYVGCEFGCTYCYARETHKWVTEKAGVKAVLPPWAAFEKQILVKTSAAHVLTRTLFPARLAGASLVIGTATDPYQPAERRFRLTRQILEALLGWRGLSLGLITKSPLILRDVDLLTQLAERHELSINISLASTDAGLLRRLEARSPAPHARLRALKGLTDAGLHAGLLIAPILPGISDSRAQLAALFQAGKDAGARYAVGAALRLGPAARTRFLPHLAEEFPELTRRYARRYGARTGAGKDYTEALARRIRSLQEEFGYPTAVGMSGRARLQGYQRRDQAIPDHAEQWTLL
ncbi:MAG: radical SAM protein [Gemmatimonadetes bacterium]|nr:radical SAM protein [Gemmatimonadota bacterium]MBK7717264.1 radical SAM protein [Gemmatimonadota bacterium]MBK9066485.1 radical SAM protein [Gemmatimonadota bacterium]